MLVLKKVTAIVCVFLRRAPTKKEDMDEQDNYRPISITAALSNHFQKVNLDQITENLRKIFLQFKAIWIPEKCFNNICTGICNCNYQKGTRR